MSTHSAASYTSPMNLETLPQEIFDRYDLSPSIMKVGKFCTNRVFLFPGDSVIKLDTDLVTRVTQDLELESGFVTVLNCEAQTPPPVQIPNVLDFDTFDSGALSGFSLARFSWIEGACMDWDTFNQLSDSEKIAIGEKAAEMMYWITETMDVHTFQKEGLDQYGSTRNWAKWLRRLHHTENTFKLSFPHLKSLQFLLYTIGTYEECLLNPSQPAMSHGDWRPPNMALQRNQYGDYELRGLVDFGQAGPSIIERDIGRLAFFSPCAGKACANRFASLNGANIDKDLIKICTVVPAVTYLYRHITYPKKKMNAAGFAASYFALRNNFPEFNWAGLESYAPQGWDTYQPQT